MFGERVALYNFTDRVRTALSRARAEADRLKDAVGPEHILLGLLADPDSLAVAMLRELDVTPELLRQRLELRLAPAPADARRPSQEYSGAGKRVLEKAMAVAQRLQHSYVGTEHLLLGILLGQEGPATATLSELGVIEVTARAAFAAVLRKQGSGGFRPSIDESSSSSIYEQIVAQVKEAVATGRLRPGERMATVRQLADELDIAPGTVARAYAELERLGVVQTDGARGTRVAERSPTAPAGGAHAETLIGLLRPVAVAAFHLGATAPELRAALETAMADIFREPPAT